MARHGQVGVRLNDVASVLPLDLAAAPAATPGSASDNWLGGAGQDGNGDWNTAADWSNGVPPASATVTFATGYTGYTVTGDATIAAIVISGDQLTFDGMISQDSSGGAQFISATNGAQLTLDQNSFVLAPTGGIDFAAGTLLDVQGTMIINGGTADVVQVDGLDGQAVVSGSLTVNQLYVQDGASYAGNVVLNNNGNITLDTSSSFGGGTVTLIGAGLIYDALAPGGTGGQTGIGEAIAFAQEGSVLTLGSDPGVTLTISGPITGAGLVLVSGGTVELSGANTYTGPTVVQNGTLIVDGAGVVPSSVVFVTDGTVVTDNVQAASYTDTIVASGTSDTVLANAGSQLVFGGAAGTLTFVGGINSSTVVGASGVLIATGGLAGDVIYGGTSGHDSLYSGAGNSTLVGGTGADLVANGAGNAVLAQWGQGATLDATQATGTTTMFGGAGVSTMLGGSGTVVAVLNSGTADVYAGHGTMDVFAGSGVLSLGYVVGFADGSTTNVLDFNVAQDQIALTGYAPGTASELLATETITGGSTILHFSDNATLTLFGVTDLTLGNFTGS